MKRIIRNSAKCLKCNTEIESTHVHDWVTCPCRALFVDGGRDYLRRGYLDGEWVETSITEGEDDE